MPHYLILLPLGVLIISLLLGKPYWQSYKRKQIKQKPFKKEWRTIIRKRMPYFKSMPTDLQLQLKQHIQVFITEKKFIGLRGVIINDEIRITIAAQACLLLLNRETDYYPKLKTILVYPRAFTKQQQTNNCDGVHFTQNVAMAGESWGFGKVILSWQDAIEGAVVPNDGRNVVIHEFAHQLDQESGFANGAPILSKHQTYEHWSTTFNQAFSSLTEDINHRQHSIFDSYGATNPAEFFAVASEVFFEQAADLKARHPDLYHELSLFYRVDPASWY